MPTYPQLGDLFGYSVSAGDGMLHIGTPGQMVAQQPFAGAVGTVHYNDAGLVTFSEPSYQYHQNVTGFESSPEAWDQFGSAVAGPSRSSRDGRVTWRPAPFGDLAR